MESSISDIIESDIRKFEAQFSQYVNQQLISLDQTHHDFMHNIEQSKETLSSLTESESALKLLQQQQAKRSELERSKLEKNQTEMKELEKELESVPPVIESLKEEVNKKEKQLSGKFSQLEAFKQEYDKQEVALRKVMRMYTDYLGLDFDSDSTALRITFRYIDRDNPTRPFSFKVTVNETNQYQVTNCAPAEAIEPQLMESLLQNLNSTNDFALFVHSMRRAFQNNVKLNNTRPASTNYILL